jgi:hypothetical protein
MQSKTSQDANRPGFAMASLAGLFLVFALFRGGMAWLVPVFLCAGAALYRRATGETGKWLVLLVCTALALGAAGFGIGKDLAARDNAIDAM